MSEVSEAVDRRVLGTRAAAAAIDVTTSSESSRSHDVIDALVTRLHLELRLHFDYILGDEFTQVASLTPCLQDTSSWLVDDLRSCIVTSIEHGRPR